MQTDQLWSKTCAVFRAEVSDDVADIWLPQLTPAGIAAGTLFLTGSDRARSWIELRYRRPLADCLERAAGEHIALALVSEADLPDGLSTSLTEAAHAAPFESTDLNPRYTFEQFVIGRSNHIGHAAALAVAEQPAQAFNPLFIYGSPGVGKTHLLHSIGNYLHRQAPELDVRYLTAEDFATSFRSVIRDGSIGEFKERLRRTDVLLIDDVQFLQNKVKTEEEFFHTFNALHESGRQLVITCDRTPRELEQVADRLRERFESGLVVEIEQPEPRLRAAILRQRVHTDRIPIDDSLALERIAEWVPANVRSLEGALIRVSAFASMRGQAVTPDLVDELLASLHPHAAQQRRPTVSVADIKSSVAQHYGLTLEELDSSGRQRRLSEPRQYAMYLCCELTRDTLPMIAAAFNRDHSTVVHARDKIAEAARTDSTVAATLDSLRKVVHSSGALPQTHADDPQILPAGSVPAERS